MANDIKHEVGQVWEDCDPRIEPARRVRIVRIDGAFCHCVPVVSPSKSARPSRLNVGTLRHPIGSTARSGYRLVSEAPNAP
jgi:hypothetical protein